MIIKIRGLRLRTIIGVNDWERKNKQEVVIHIELHFDGNGAAKSDQLEDTINYKALTKEIISLVEGSHFFLLEKLVDKILEKIMEDQRIQKVEVEIEKPGALRFSDSVSITSSAERDS